MTHARPGRAVRFLALSLVLFAGPGNALAQDPPRTWQEENNYRAGPTPFEPLMAFWYELAASSPKVTIQPLTRTLLDREFTLVTISSHPILSPQDALRTGKPIVLIGNSVHGGETAGKEASQLVARELVMGELQPLLDDVIVLFVPLINPDGGEVRRRTNEEGFDMNRDYVKLESQEIHALVTKVLNEWTPDIHVDTHHGGSAPYTLTWQGTLNPAADPELRAYTYDVIFPRLREALRANDYDGFDYSGPRVVNGQRGWGSTSVEPRKHHVYTGLVNSLGILLESPGNTHRLRRNGSVIEKIPEEEEYFHRVAGQRIAIEEILRVAAERGAEIRQLTTSSRLRAVRNGETYDESDRIVLEYELGSRGRESVWMPDSTAALGYSPQQVDVYLRYDTVRTTSRPLGYVLPVSMSRAIPLLQDHGITVHRFTRPTPLELEVYHATEVRETEYFQGHYLMAAGAEKEVEVVDVPAGAFFVSTAQPKGNLIAYLLEPETDDNLITWGYANHLLPESNGEGGRARRQIPMMRLVRPQQPMSLLEVVPFNEYSRNRYFQAW